MSPPHLAELVFAGGLATELARLVDVPGGAVLGDLDSATTRSVLPDVEILITGWGCPPITPEVLEAAPRLRAVVHAGGAAATLFAEQSSAKDLYLSNAGEPNALPVAEYTIAMILLAGKDATGAERLYRERRTYLDREIEFAHTGNFGRTVGVVGASRVGRQVLRLLRGFDLEVLLHDPYVDAASLGVEGVSLTELMRRSDVVTLHQPVTLETIGMIGRDELALLRDGATLINTARGEVIDQDALVDELRRGRLRAVLDVSTPDPLPEDHPLWEVPHLTITPHIAGSTGSELRRLGRHVVDEVARLVSGRPPRVLEQVGER
ncbi:hydroxyacid dehydrogenase [Pseudactinotalea suaedae]|uniref:hydroxyacid dehydrogenase n=1 Tax=Pseudactinotalea suaedae TaxID=1524924 RepID=UPI0012E1AFA0|nr:hydroxyacid dehydrogenase [Pseudactinotalea suaedae]